MARPIRTKNCKICEVEFLPISGKQKCCGESCSKENNKTNKKRTAPQWYQENRSRQAVSHRQWKEQNPEYMAQYVRERRWRSYGVTPEFIAQEKLKGCAICGKKNRLHVDHDHATDIYRGILCVGCNTGLGQLGDNVDGLMRAVAYLMKSQDVLGGI